MNKPETKPAPYVPLHLTSYYSLLSEPKKLATSSPSQLLQRAKALGYSMVAVTDTTFASLGSTVQAGIDEQISIIPGIELPVWLDEKGPTYLTFLAQNNPGLYLLYQWATAVAVEDKRLTPVEITSTQTDEQVITFWRGDYHRAAEHLADDGAFWALDYPTAAIRNKAKEIQRKQPNKTVVMHEVNLASRDDLPIWKFLNAVVAIEKKRSIPTTPLKTTLKSPEEMAELYPEESAALARTVEIAQSCQVTFPRKPETKAIIAEGRDSFDFLAELVTTALRQKQANARELHSLASRADHELSLIKALGFADYLLICYEIAQFCHQNQIECMVSGSGNNSVVLWLIGVVRIDPQSLLFERFINSERAASLPDVDFLLPYDQVATVMNFLLRRYPEEAKRLSIIKRMRQASIVELADKANYELSETDQLQLEARELPFQVATHPSGIMLDREAPKHLAAKTTVLSQWDKDNVEKHFNKFKFDLLTSDAVSHIHDTKNQLRAENKDEQIQPNLIAPLMRLHSGEVIGITTCESPHMQQVLVDVGRVSSKWSVDTASQALALARLEYTLRDVYLKNSLDSHPLGNYPEIRAVLQHTRYTAIYQEQLMRIATEIAGWSWKKADTLRKMMSEKVPWDDRQQLLLALRQALLERQYPQQIAELLQQQLLYFNSYSFVEGHSLALAQLDYDQAFYLDTYPEHYWIAVLKRLGDRQSEMLYPDQVYFNEMLRQGLSFYFPADSLPNTPQLLDGLIIPGRRLFTKKKSKAFESHYQEFLDLLGRDSTPSQLIAFQQQHFNAVLTHNPVEAFPSEFRFDPLKNKQTIIANVVVKRRFKDHLFVTVDSNELIHTTVPQEVLWQADQAYGLTSLKSGQLYGLEIGKSLYRDDHWIVLQILPNLVTETKHR